ncbi:hypothetical protein HAX54_004903 [Datura stramonium]|uniref:Uncharacterized protein n=1 Tax=Datura stramonium TaxID=4076 RepID=A0ABS8T940_DATST|nr:hypothetical protein [Datura stramonium]
MIPSGYKMPRDDTKIEGVGMASKTNVVNMVDIAKALTQGDQRLTPQNILVVSLELSQSLMKKLELPLSMELMILPSLQMIQLKCAACGFISDVDMRDKLTTFIAQEPTWSKKVAKDKKAMRRAEKERLKEGEVADEELKKLKKEAKKKSSFQEASVKPTSKESQVALTGIMLPHPKGM